MKALLITVICLVFAFMADAYFIGSGHEEQLLEASGAVGAVCLVARGTQWLRGR